MISFFITLRSRTLLSKCFFVKVHVIRFSRFIAGLNIMIYIES